MSRRLRVTLALLSLCGCVDLSRPSALAEIDLQDAADPEADGNSVLPDRPASEGPGPDLGHPDGGSSDQPIADVPPADRPIADTAVPPDQPIADAAPPIPDAAPPMPDAAPPDQPADLVPVDRPPDAMTDAAGSCSSEGDCGMGYSCIDQMCTAVPGLALHWKLDETSGSQAADDSGNAFQGTYGGATGIPAPVTAAPTLQFPNPGSRSFVGSSRQEVRLASLPMTLRRSNDVTVSAWVRASRVTDSSGYANIISVGDGYGLYIGRDSLGMFKRRVNRDYVFCQLGTTSHLDGQWHHLAGSTSTSGMRFFLDGTQRCSNSVGSTIEYAGTPVVLVGRDPDPAYGWYFEGEIDDARAYTRALSTAEIAKLGAGGR
jgi:Concanavalin A-like lectin/glucanases superfamily